MSEGRFKVLLWVIIAVVLLGVFFQAAMPQAPIMMGLGILAMLVAFGFLIYWLQWWGLILIVVVAFLIGCLILFGAIGQWSSNWGNTFPVPDPPSSRQVWEMENIGWPAGVYLILISIGYATSWMSGAKGVVAAVITAVCSFLGALMLGQPEAWGTAILYGMGGSFLGFATSLINKPVGGAAPLTMAVMALLFGFIYLFITPLQAWVVYDLGFSSAIAGVTAIAGYSAGAGIFSAAKNGLLGG